MTSRTKGQNGTTVHTDWFENDPGIKFKTDFRARKAHVWYTKVQKLRSMNPRPNHEESLGGINDSTILKKHALFSASLWTALLSLS